MNHDAEVVAIGAGESAEGDSVPAVVLAVREEVLPIFVTPSQAHSIGMVLRGEPFDRPLTHDLLTEVLTEFGGAVDRVRIDDLSEGTFFAKVDVERYDDGRAERFVFDARPSDALALAVRSECEIVVSDEVVDEAGRPPEAIGFDVEDEIDGFGSDEDDGPSFGSDPDDPFGR
ncbi:bifunctional nuclease family protein [Haloparvum alkalitolerans]|uniref:bifunctional nuclease family protein n=1 Tax=Haloparvum alkalitolerans TaxID=1042953 RepID=UPI003CF02381